MRTKGDGETSGQTGGGASHQAMIGITAALADARGALVAERRASTVSERQLVALETTYLASRVVI